MNFKYTYIITRTIPMPHGNRCIDSVYLTNNPNYAKELAVLLNATNIIEKIVFKKHQWIQFQDETHDIDIVRYLENTSLSDKHHVFCKGQQRMTREQMHDKYKHFYKLDLKDY